VIRLQVLGSVQLADTAGRELRAVLAQPKRLALLAYLAITNRLHRRDRLVAMFWPELDDAHARGALNQAISFLRREVGPSAVSALFSTRGGEELGIESSAVWCDVTAFREALKAANHGEALELYGGDLLDGFHAGTSACFDEWLDSERTRLRDDAARAARLAAEELEAEGHVTTAVASARRGCELSHPDERAVRQLLELLDRLGDRAGALHAYESFAERLSRELDVGPSPETVAIIERIRAGSGARARPSKTDEAAPPPPGAPQFDLDRWRIERQLGRGGTSTVYLARDVRHGRPVALKTMRRELIHDRGVDRFLREVQITASLAHPHILPLIDSGASGGMLYLVTPYITGESLRSRLRRQPALEVTDALRIAREIAGALDYAHRRGVVHRDIKPENVLLADGHAIVADFGIATTRVESLQGGQGVETESIDGSPGYMSPERARGDGGAAVRSDIYSFGCVIHEMLTGDLPQPDDSPSDVRRRRGAVPPEVARLIAECVARDPERRPSNAASISRAIDRSLARLQHSHNPARRLAWTDVWSSNTRRHRAIVAAALIAGVVVSWLAIAFPWPATEASTALSETSTLNREAFESFLRGNAALARREERAASFDAVRGYSHAVELDSGFADAWAGLARAHAFIAWHALDPTVDHEKPAHVALERARRLAPLSAATLRAIGEVTFHTAGVRRIEEARRALRAALQRDSTDSELLTFIAQVELRAEQAASAVALAERATAANPRDASATTMLLTAYAYSRRFGDAVRVADRLVLQDPDDPDSYLLRAMLAIMQDGDTAAAGRDVASAIRELGNKTLLDAANWAVHPLLRIDMSLASVLDAVPVEERVGDARMEYYWMAMHRAGFSGRPRVAKAFADSILAIAREIELAGRRAHPLWPSDALIVLGRTDEAMKLADAIPRATQAPWPAYEWARLYASAGRQDKSLVILERLLERPSYVTPALLRIDPGFATLRGEPRFERLLTRASSFLGRSPGVS
jgi:serine/threonine protein kinase/DNA-binding SARP family transcriptional activator